MPAEAPVLEVRGLRVVSGTFTLGPIDLGLSPGEVLVVLGPNGAGKTTLLRSLAGLEPIAGGSIRLAGEEVGNLPPQRRRVGLVFQDLALFPQRTVEENVAYGLAVRGPWTVEKEATLRCWLDQFNLTALAGRLPQSLSGGERQRVALARALAPAPRLLLLDEPLAAADPRRRREMQGELAEWLRMSEVPAIYVTHDLEEALLLGDRLLVLWGGQALRAGPTTEVLQDPGEARVAWFLGYNVLRMDGELWGVHPADLSVHAPGERRGIPARVLRAVSTWGGTRWILRREDGAPGEGVLEAWSSPTGEQQAHPRGSAVGLSIGRRVRLRGPWPPPD
jgi:thiamine transport system ATP-binding protein